MNAAVSRRQLLRSLLAVGTLAAAGCAVIDDDDHPPGDQPVIGDGTFVDHALSKDGAPYVWGAAGPDAFDCSGLIWWALQRAGMDWVNGSINQWAAVREAGTTLDVADAINTRAALLFRMNTAPRHVAISLGDGRTIEARGRAYGVGTFSALGRAWTGGGLVPALAG